MSRAPAADPSLMADTLAASFADLLLGFRLTAGGQDANNRLSLDGLSWSSNAEGTLEIGLRRFEALSLHLSSGALTLEVGRLALDQVVAQVRIEAGRPRLLSLRAAHAELAGVRVQGPVAFPPPGQAKSSVADTPAVWSLVPLATAEGRIAAEIVDAHLLFDADVTAPIRQGQVDFNQVTVEHVGPDSRMGVSRLGVYVDAPNGRSYLYQFPSAPVAGVEYEQRGALLGPRVTNRGRLRLQDFAEALVRQGRGAPGVGLTEQARLLFDRTSVSGDVQLGDGRFAAPGVQAELTGRAAGRNAVRVHSAAVGRGLSLELDALSARQAAIDAGGLRLGADEVTGTLMLRVFVEGGQLRFAFDLASLKLAGLHLAAP